MALRRLFLLAGFILCIFVAMATNASASPGAYRVLVAYTDGDVEPVTLEGMLRAQPGVAKVDAVDINNGVPTQATFNSYDLVITQNDSTIVTDNLAPLGDALANFVDQGGVVVTDAYADEGPMSGFSPTGRWIAGDGYYPFTNADNSNLDPRTLGTFDATSPLMQGVTALSSPGWNSSPEPTAGTTVVAHWNDGANLIGYKGRVVGIAAHLGNETGGNPEHFSGDWGVVDINAVRWLGFHTLGVTKGGTGGGSVSSAPGGISCGASCSADYPYITSVTLTEAPDATSAFAGWGGACSGSANTCTVSVDAAKSVTAAFTRVQGPATASLRSKTVAINLRSGKGKLSAACTNLPTDVCSFALTLTASSGGSKSSSIAHKVKVGTAKGKIAGGKSGKLTVKLTRKGRALLKKAKHHKLKVTVSGSSKNNAGAATNLKSRKVTLKGH
jgi:hypothetical protein